MYYVQAVMCFTFTSSTRVPSCFIATNVNVHYIHTSVPIHLLYVHYILVGTYVYLYLLHLNELSTNVVMCVCFIIIDIPGEIVTASANQRCTNVGTSYASVHLYIWYLSLV